MNQDIKKLHITIAKYFNRKVLYMDEPTQKKPNIRKLFELPWQQTKGEMWDEVSDTLSDLLFLEAKCKIGGVYDVLNDFDNSELLIRIPELKYVRQAVSSSQLGLSLEPDYYLQMLWNRLKWLLPAENNPPVFLRNLDKAKKKLMNSPAWLRANAPLPETRQLKPQEFPIDAKTIQTLSMDSKSLVITDGFSTIDTLDITTGKPIIQRLIIDQHILGITLNSNNNRITSIDKSGYLYIENNKSKYRTRQNENLLETVSGYLIYINNDNSLIALEPIDEKVNILLENVPKPLVILNKSRKGEGILFVAGYRKQVCGIAVFSSNEWSVKLLTQLSAPIVAGDIDIQSGLIALVTADSCIYLMDFEKEDILKQCFYQYETESLLRGMAKKISFGIGPTFGTIFLATETGQVWNWNFTTGKFSSYGDYKKHKECRILICLGVWSDTGLPFVSSENNAQTLILSELNSNISQPVTGVCFTNDLHIVTANYEGHSVRFYRSEGLKKINQYLVSWPISLNQCNEADTIWVGCETGLFCKIGPETTDISNDGVLIDNPVIGIFKSTQSDMVWVAQRNGDIMCMPAVVTDVLQDKKRIKILYCSTVHEKRLKVLPASDKNSFWCMTAIESSHNLNISLISDNHEAMTLDRSPYLYDMAVSNDYKLFASAGDSINIYHFFDRDWKLLYTCIDSVKLIAFNGSSKFLVTANECWLVVREISPGLPVITAHDLSSKINCLAVKNNNIAVGMQDGNIVSFLLESNVV
jgi:hypothetical protein